MAIDVSIGARRESRFLPALALLFLAFFLPVGADAVPLRVGIVTPSPCDDLSWSQSLCEGARQAAREHPMDLTIREGLSDPDEAGRALRRFAEEGYDLVIAHGTQYQTRVEALAPLFPTVSFAFGTGDVTRSPNIFAYDPQPQEGAYLMGMAAGLMTRSNVLALISPTDVRDALFFNRGFERGVKAVNPDAVVGITYLGQFDDLESSRTLAQAHIRAGADILSGSGQQALGALQAAREAPDVYWMANDFDMSRAAPEKILAAQSYQYAGLLVRLAKLREQGVPGGQVFPLSLSRRNVTLTWSPHIPPLLLERLKKTQRAIEDGSFVPDIRILRYDFQEGPGT